MKQNSRFCLSTGVSLLSKEYLTRQKEFWSVPSNLKEAKFTRISFCPTPTEAAWSELAEQAAGEVLPCVPLDSEWTILDLGCGIGRLMKVLRNRTKFRRLIGVDFSEKMINFAREYLGSDPQMDWFVNNGYDLSTIGSAQIDFAYSFGMFPSIDDWDIILSYMRETQRVLKPGSEFLFDLGRFDFKQAFSNSPGGRWAQWMHRLGFWSLVKNGRKETEPAGFKGSRFTLTEVRQLIRKSGLLALKIQMKERNGFPFFWCLAHKPPQ